MYVHVWLEMQSVLNQNNDVYATTLRTKSLPKQRWLQMLKALGEK